MGTSAPPCQGRGSGKYSKLITYSRCLSSIRHGTVLDKVTTLNFLLKLLPPPN